jgi:hypothetical protein
MPFRRALRPGGRVRRSLAAYRDPAADLQSSVSRSLLKGWDGFRHSSVARHASGTMRFELA